MLAPCPGEEGIANRLTVVPNPICGYFRSKSDETGQLTVVIRFIVPCSGRQHVHNRDQYCLKIVLVGF